MYTLLSANSTYLKQNSSSSPNFSNFVNGTTFVSFLCAECVVLAIFAAASLSKHCVFMLGSHIFKGFSSTQSPRLKILKWLLTLLQSGLPIWSSSPAAGFIHLLINTIVLGLGNTTMKGQFLMVEQTS